MFYPSVNLRVIWNFQRLWITSHTFFFRYGHVAHLIKYIDEHGRLLRRTQNYGNQDKFMASVCSLCKKACRENILPFPTPMLAILLSLTYKEKDMSSMLQLYMNPKRNYSGAHTRIYGDTNISVYKLYQNGCDLKGLKSSIRLRHLTTRSSAENL